MGCMRHSGSEDASRSGYRMEDMDITSMEGDLPISASALVDTNGVSDSPTVAKLQELARLKNSERVVNVVTGTNLLSDYEVDYYFTAAFPTIFPYGSGKHLDGRRRDQLSLSRWIQLLLKHSSRYFPTAVYVTHMLYVDDFNDTMPLLPWLLMSQGDDKMPRRLAYRHEVTIGRLLNES